MKRRGAVLMLVLWLVACIFVVSAGFLSRTGHESDVARLVHDSTQARELAWAGLESVRVKLLNDSNFPPSVLKNNQDFFSYTEEVVGMDGDKIGLYQLHLDRRWVDPPYEMLRVVCIGEVGSDSNPVRHKLTCEFLMSPGNRGDLVNLLDVGEL